MIHIFHRFLKQTDGAVSVIIAVTLPLLIAFVATAVNIAHFQIETSRALDNAKVLCNSMDEYLNKIGYITYNIVIDYAHKHYDYDLYAAENVARANKQSSLIGMLPENDLDSGYIFHGFSNVWISYPFPLILFEGITPKRFRIKTICKKKGIKASSIVVIENPFKEFEVPYGITNISSPYFRLKDENNFEWDLHTDVSPSVRKYLLENPYEDFYYHIYFSGYSRETGNNDNMSVALKSSYRSADGSIIKSSKVTLSKDVYLYPGNHIFGYTSFMSLDKPLDPPIEQYLDKISIAIYLDKVGEPQFSNRLATFVPTRTDDVEPDNTVSFTIRESGAYKLSIRNESVGDHGMFPRISRIYLANNQNN